MTALGYIEGGQTRKIMRKYREEKVGRTGALVSFPLLLNEGPILGTQLVLKSFKHLSRLSELPLNDLLVVLRPRNDIAFEWVRARQDSLGVIPDVRGDFLAGCVFGFEEVERPEEVDGVDAEGVVGQVNSWTDPL